MGKKSKRLKVAKRTSGSPKSPTSTTASVKKKPESAIAAHAIKEAADKEKRSTENPKSAIVSAKTKPEITAVPSTSSPGSEADADSDQLQELLELCSKEQLVEFLIDAALADDVVFRQVGAAADRDVTHRKIFVYGLGWDTTNDVLSATFEPFGDLEECNVVIDKATGKAKGYGFVLFKTRASAIEALKEPQKKIKNRLTSCQLASLGPPAPGSVHDTIGRRIYVSNVHTDIDPEKLRYFFSKFGEIEMGPIGFDTNTGKSRGFALFLYKTQDGARKVLEEPYKMFEGHRLHCQVATENNAQRMLTQASNTRTPSLAGAAAMQNLALLSHNPNLNAAYNALLLSNQNQGLLPLQVNPLAGAMVTPLIGSLSGTPPVLAAYGSGAMALQNYQAAQLGQPSLGKGNAAGISSFPWCRSEVSTSEKVPSLRVQDS